MNKSITLTIIFSIAAFLTITTNVYAERLTESAVNAFQVDQGATRPANDDDVAAILLKTSGSDQLPYTGEGVTVAIYDLGGAEAHPLYADRLTVSDQAQQNILVHATRLAGIVATFALNANINSHDNLEYKPMEDGSSDIAVHSWGNIECSRNGMYSSESARYDGYDIPLIFAAGNSGSDCENYVDGFGTILGGAQSGKNIITVGSTDNNGIVSYFSSKGPTLDGRIAPIVVLPGENVVSTCTNSTLCAASGTSYTAPAAGGIAAQLLEQYRTFSGENASIAPASLRALFANSAVDLGNAGPDYTYGFGQINAVEASEQLYNITENSIANGETDNKYLTVASQQSLRVTLAWNDLPDDTNATTALVNNLDLLLISPSGVEHRPFILDPINPSSLATTGIDRLNTIEQVVVDNPEQGEWTVRVSGANVTDQAYSVVSSSEVGTGVGLNAPLAVSLNQVGATTTTPTALFITFTLIAIATISVAKND